MKFKREEFLEKLSKFAPEKPKAAKLSNSNPIPSGEIFWRFMGKAQSTGPFL